MDRKTIEYIIVIIAVTLVIYLGYSFIDYHYSEQIVQFDSITMHAPESSQYEISHDSIEFKNPYEFYHLNVSKVDSSDKRVKTLFNFYNHFRVGHMEYLNENFQVLYVDMDEGQFSNHAMIIPIDSFDADGFSFKNRTSVWIFDGKNREFVKDSVLNAEVAYES